MDVIRATAHTPTMTTIKAPWVAPQGFQGTLSSGDSLFYDGVDLGIYNSSTTEGQNLAKLTHLWTLAHSTALTAPQLSQFYMCKFRDTCVKLSIPLHQSVERTFCYNCGAIRVYGVNCRVRTVKEMDMPSLAGAKKVATTIMKPSSTPASTPALSITSSILAPAKPVQQETSVSVPPAFVTAAPRLAKKTKKAIIESSASLEQKRVLLSVKNHVQYTCLVCSHKQAIAEGLYTIDARALSSSGPIAASPSPNASASQKPASARQPSRKRGRMQPVSQAGLATAAVNNLPTTAVQAVPTTTATSVAPITSIPVTADATSALTAAQMTDSVSMPAVVAATRTVTPVLAAEAPVKSTQPPKPTHSTASAAAPTATPTTPSTSATTATRPVSAPAATPARPLTTPVVAPARSSAPALKFPLPTKKALGAAVPVAAPTASSSAPRVEVSKSVSHKTQNTGKPVMSNRETSDSDEDGPAVSMMGSFASGAGKAGAGGMGTGNKMQKQMDKKRNALAARRGF